MVYDGVFFCMLQDNLDTARRCFRGFLFMMNTLSHKAFLKYIVHCLDHECDDAETFECHLGNIAAYAFENFLMKFPEVR